MPIGKQSGGAGSSPAYIVAAGTNTYTGSYGSYAAYQAGDAFTVLFTNGNTAASTLNINSLGAKSIKKDGGTDLASGDITSGEVKLLVYDGTNFQIIDDADVAGGVLQGSYPSPNIIDAFRAATTAGVDTYTATIAPAITAYAAGQFFLLKFASANTGAATINLNALGAKDIKKNVSSALVSGDIAAGQELILAYDGTNFQIVGGSVAIATVAQLNAGTDNVAVATSLGLQTSTYGAAKNIFLFQNFT